MAIKPYQVILKFMKELIVTPELILKPHEIKCITPHCRNVFDKRAVRAWMPLNNPKLPYDFKIICRPCDIEWGKKYLARHKAEDELKLGEIKQKYDKKYGAVKGPIRLAYEMRTNPKSVIEDYENNGS